MTKYLRNAVEKMRKHYITVLVDSGNYSGSEPQLYELTLSELKEEYRKVKPTETVVKKL
jgi:hypothetical protein